MQITWFNIHPRLRDDIKDNFLTNIIEDIQTNEIIRDSFPEIDLSLVVVSMNKTNKGLDLSFIFNLGDSYEQIFGENQLRQYRKNKPDYDPKYATEHGMGNRALTLLKEVRNIIFPEDYKIRPRDSFFRGESFLSYSCHYSFKGLL